MNTANVEITKMITQVGQELGKILYHLGEDRCDKDSLCNGGAAAIQAIFDCNFAHIQMEVFKVMIETRDNLLNEEMRNIVGDEGPVGELEADQPDDLEQLREEVQAKLEEVKSLVAELEALTDIRDKNLI